MTGDGHPGRARSSARSPNTPVTATAPQQNGGFVVTGSFMLVNSAGQPLLTTGPGQRDHARGPHAGHRPAVRRHRPDQRRRRHRQRADQPVHQAGHRQQALLQPLQLAAHDGGPVRRLARVAAASTARATRLRGPARPGPVRLRRLQQRSRQADPSANLVRHRPRRSRPARRGRGSRSRATPCRLRSGTARRWPRRSVPRSQTPDPAAGPDEHQCTFKVTLVARSGAVPVSPRGVHDPR